MHFQDDFIVYPPFEQKLDFNIINVLLIPPKRALLYILFHFKLSFIKRGLVEINPASSEELVHGLQSILKWLDLIWLMI